MNIEPCIIAALVTPLDNDENLDVPGLERLIESVLQADMGGLFLAGTIGEGPALRDRVRGELFREAARVTRGRVPVLVNVSDTGTMRALDQVAAAVEAGVDGVVLTPRLSFPARTPDDTRRHVENVARASAIPVWFYENPVTTPVTSTFEAIRDLMALPNVVALKYSGSDKAIFERCVKELPGRPPCFNGNVPEIAASARLGGGAISGIGSLLPGLCARLFDVAKRGETAEADLLQKAIVHVYSIYGGDGWPLWPGAQKHVLMRRGILSTNRTTAPFRSFGPREEAIIDAALEKIEPWVFDLNPVAPGGA